MQKNNCPADNKQEKKEIAHEPTTMENANNVGNAECATEPLPIPIVEEVAPVVPQHEADAAPVEANEEQEEQPEPEVFTGEELKKGLGWEVMKRIELVKAVFDDQPKQGHPNYLKHYSTYFSYACYYEKEEEDTDKGFSFISDGYLYASNLEENPGREVFALRIKLDNMNPEGAPMVEKNNTEMTPLVRVISCTLCMYFHETTGLINKDITRQICIIIHNMSPVVQNRILVQRVKGRDVVTILNEDRVYNYVIITVGISRKKL